MSRIRVIIGPPCAGKSTYVQKNRADGDVVVDLDMIAHAFGSRSSHDAPQAVREVAFRVRESAIDAVLSGDMGAWVIHTNPPAGSVDRYKEHDAEFVLIDPGMDVCLERAKERPDWTGDAIRGWYESPPALPKSTTPKRSEPMKIKNVALSGVKAGPDDGLKEGEFVVYPSTFTREPDSYGDVIAKGAFADTIKDWQDSGNTLPGLYGHRMDDPDFFVASANEMGEDDHGWWVKGEFDMESPKGAQVYRLVKGRRLNQLSFAYDVLEEGAVEISKDTTANELRKLKVFEFSFVPVGANQDTSVVAVKAITEDLMHELKVGRVLAAKHITSLRKAQEAIGAVIVAAEGEQEDDQGKASGKLEAKSGASDEEPSGAKSSVSDEEPKAGPSVARLAAQAHIYALTSAEGGSK